MNNKEFVNLLIKKIELEINMKDRSGVYGLTSRTLAYNSNKIEGSILTENQTASLFETGTINSQDSMYLRSKDIEEMNGHFLMFNDMLKTYNEKLSKELMKKYHYDLKIGVFEDKANGYPIGEFKKYKNTVGGIITALPQNVDKDLDELLDWYNKIDAPTIKDIAIFHSKYEAIHPFQDGNGRTGRIIIFKECLKNKIMPIIIKDEDKLEYYNALNESNNKNYENLIKLFEKSQEKYFNEIKDMVIPYEG